MKFQPSLIVLNGISGVAAYIVIFQINFNCSVHCTRQRVEVGSVTTFQDQTIKERV